MGKLKPKKAAVKRIKNITRRGKVITRRSSAQHLATNKSKRTIRHSRANASRTDQHAKNLKVLVAG